MKKFATAILAVVACAGVVAPTMAEAKKAKKKPITLKVGSGTASTTFTQEFIQSLVTAGVVPSAIAPATLDGLTLNLPITGGTVKAKGKSATIKTDGGQQLAKGTDTRTISNITTKVKGSKTTVVADAGGTILGAPGLTFLEGTGATFKLTKKTFTSTGQLKLSDLAAADLQTNFGVNIPAGTVIGTGKIVAKK